MASNLVTPATLHKKIIGVVKKYVETESELVFDYFSESKSKLALKNKDRHYYRDGDEKFYLCKVKNLRGLYIHIDLTYKIPDPKASLEKNTFGFEGLSLQFLHGTGKFFCRADWEVKEKKDKLAHPQPHWHWGEGFEDDDKSNAEQAIQLTPAIEQQGGFYEEVGVEPVGVVEEQLPKVNFEALHYAMASKWTQRDEYSETFTEAGLVAWLQRAMQHVIDQYSYQVNKGRFESCKNWL